MKLVFAARGLPICDYEVVLERDWQRDERAMHARTSSDRLGFPVFVKPANLGSSVGISKAQARHRAADGDRARGGVRSQDRDRGRRARRRARSSVAVLGNDEPEASVPGEIIPSREFYDYEAKYLDDASRDGHSGAADRGADGSESARWRSPRSRRSTGAGMARVDFLLAGDTGVLYLNEVNTIPGFTTISMYSKMWDASGLPYPQLLDRLVELASSATLRSSER